jgi:hypothetical protein
VLPCDRDKYFISNSFGTFSSRLRTWRKTSRYARGEHHVCLAKRPNRTSPRLQVPSQFSVNTAPAGATRVLRTRDHAPSHTIARGCADADKETGEIIEERVTAVLLYHTHLHTLTCPLTCHTGGRLHGGRLQEDLNLDTGAALGAGVRRAVWCVVRCAVRGPTPCILVSTMDANTTFKTTSDSQRLTH